MNIKELLELGKKRTQGNWEYMQEGKRQGYQYISRDGRKQLDDSVVFEDGVYPIDDNDMEYIAAAPQMEAKLREVVGMLPEIKQLLDELTMQQHFGKPAVEMIEKLKHWENK